MRFGLNMSAIIAAGLAFVALTIPASAVQSKYFCSVEIDLCSQAVHRVFTCDLPPKPANATVWEPGLSRNRELTVSCKQEVGQLTFFEVFAWFDKEGIYVLPPHTCADIAVIAINRMYPAHSAR